MRRQYKGNEDILKTIRKLHNRCQKHVRRGIEADRRKRDEYEATEIAKEIRPTKRWKKFDKFTRKRTKKDRKQGLLDKVDNKLKTAENGESKNPR